MVKKHVRIYRPERVDVYEDWVAVKVSKAQLEEIRKTFPVMDYKEDKVSEILFPARNILIIRYKW